MNDWSIRAKGVVAILVPFFSVCVLIISCYLYESYQKNYHKLDMQGKALVNSVAYLGRLSILLNDVKMLQDGVVLLLHETDYVSVDVIDNMGVAHLSLNKKSSENIESSSLIFEKEIFESDASEESLGNVKMVISLSGVIKNFWLHLSLISSVFVFLMIVFYFFLLRFLSFELFAPINSASKSLELLKEDNCSIDLDVFSDRCFFLNFNKNIKNIEKYTDKISKENNEYISEIIKYREEIDILNYEKSKFLALITDNISNPLVSIYAVLQVLENTSMSGVQKEYVNVSVGLIGDTIRLVDDIFEFSNIDYDRVSIENKSFDFNELIVSTVSFFREEAIHKKLDMSLVFVDDIEPELLSVIGDQHRIRQVLMSVLSNAVKFTSFGSVFICVNVFVLKDHKIKLKVRVKDTGCGIDRSEVVKMSSMFKETSDYVSRKNYEGFWPDLVNVKRIVDLLGGSIHVKSEVCKGTEFTIDFLLDSYNSDTYVSAGLNQVKDEEGWKILLVENRSSNREAFVVLMNHAGVLVDVVSDKNEGLECFVKTNYDLVFVDYSISTTDGFEISRKMREIEVKRSCLERIPILAITDSGYKNIEEECYKHGMDGVISEPVMQFDLYAYVKNHIRVKQQMEDVVF